MEHRLPRSRSQSWTASRTTTRGNAGFRPRYGIIIVGTLLLFLVALTLYGGYLMFFAAKDTVEWWSERRRRRIFERGRDRGQKDERRRIKQELERRGAPLTPELAEILDEDGDKR